MGVARFAFAAAQDLKPSHEYPTDAFTHREWGVTNATMLGTVPSSWIGGAPVKESLGTTWRVSKRQVTGAPFKSGSLTVHPLGACQGTVQNKVALSASHIHCLHIFQSSLYK